MQFLRWSCEKLLNSNCHSVLAFIVPLSFLEAESYKYARKYLVEHFSHIWTVFIDTDARTGIRGDSLFYTMQGRAVILLTRKYKEYTAISEINYFDMSKGRRAEKIATLETDIQTIMDSFKTFSISDETYSFMPSKPFNQELYNSFWPISNNNGSAVFLNQCSGAKMAPTSLLTHTNKSLLKRRSREIANSGIDKAHEWIGGQDKTVVDEKITAFQNALNTCAKNKLDTELDKHIRPCSFRPFVNSYALLWDTVFKNQAGVGGGGARIRPEIKAVYERNDTIGFSLAHAPKDLDESLGQFASFCWYFPDNDLSRRGNGHIYLNQYIPDVKSNKVINNVHKTLITHLTSLTGLSDERECARKMVFYSYAIFCSQVYLDEFYGALFVVNQSDSRARIPIVADKETFLHLVELGEKLANLEKNGTTVKNVLKLNYKELIDKLPKGFRLKHSRSASCNPFDEINEQFIIRGENIEEEIRVPCPVAIQKFTVAGYNVIKDCWLKFHSYRFTHSEFTSNDFRDLLDLFNKIATQMKLVSEVDELFYGILNGEISLLDYKDV